MIFAEKSKKIKEALSAGLPLPADIIDKDPVVKYRTLITQYSWFLPTENNINILKNTLKNMNARNILDIGCGSGYWVNVLKNDFICEGIRLNKYSSDEIDIVDNCKEKNFYLLRDNELSKYDTFLLLWPPYNNNLAYSVLKKFDELDHLRNMIYVGEDEGGCTANDAFFVLLESLEMDNKYDIKYISIDSYEFIRDFMITIQKKD